MLAIERVKRHKGALVARYARSDDTKGLTQLLTTLAPLALLWLIAIRGATASLYITAAAMPFITLFTLRVFALMHECGHGCLFRSRRLNRAAGFVLGVIAGMPQYVWSQHHNYHHAHNGNWRKYRGPYATRSVAEYEAMTSIRQRMYRSKCSIAAAPLAGFIYLIFTPRFTWMKGSACLLFHSVKRKIAQPGVSMRIHASNCATPYWKSPREYRHMLWNNIVLLSGWALMCWVTGAGLFFAIYLLCTSFAGGAGIVLFTVQHNFEQAYASDGTHWDYDTAAIEGTSFLILPRWLNWFTANIAYHHIHHLSSSIPGYRLPECHEAYHELFSTVTRIRLSQIPHSVTCILWDVGAQRIVSMAEYRRQRGQPAGPPD